jgi:hypothetical protein
MHAVEPLVPETSSFKVEITVKKLKRYINRYLSNFGRTDPSRK